MTQLAIWPLLVIHVSLAASCCVANVSIQAIGNNCYISLSANFLDVFQLIVFLFLNGYLAAHTLKIHRLVCTRSCKCSEHILCCGIQKKKKKIRLILWEKYGVCIMVVFGYMVLLHLSLATFLTSLRRVNRAETRLCFFFFFLFVLVILSCVWDPAFRKPDLLGSDLLFFTSPTFQSPASVAVKRNGWYFRGELLFPFLATIFYLNVWKCECHCSNHKFSLCSTRHVYVKNAIILLISTLFLSGRKLDTYASSRMIEDIKT